MPKISRWKVDSNKAGLFKEDLWSVITLLGDKKQVRTFLTEFLTPTERLMLAKRFQAVFMIRAGADYRLIKERLHMSESTIAKLTNQITDGHLSTVMELADRLLELKGSKWVLEEIGYPKRRGMPGDLLSPLVSELVRSAGPLAFGMRKKGSV